MSPVLPGLLLHKKGVIQYWVTLGTNGLFHKKGSCFTLVPRTSKRRRGKGLRCIYISSHTHPQNLNYSYFSFGFVSL